MGLEQQPGVAEVGGDGGVPGSFKSPDDTGTET